MRRPLGRIVRGLSEESRLLVAGHPATSVQILARLVHDPSPDVRGAAIIRPELPDAWVVEQMDLEDLAHVLPVLLMRPSILGPEDLDDVLEQWPDDVAALCGVASHPDCSPDVLAWLASHPDRIVGETARAHPLYPQSIQEEG